MKIFPQSIFLFFVVIILMINLNDALRREGGVRPLRGGIHDNARKRSRSQQEWLPFPTTYEQHVVSVNCYRGTVNCNLANRRLESLQGVVFPSSVKIINLDRNKIRSFDDVIISRTFPRDLELLSMDSNKIKISESGLDLSHCESLKVLRMDHNRIESMDRVRLPWTLKHLSLRGNQLKNLSVGNHNALPSLNVLDLGLNRIDKLQGSLKGAIPPNVKTLKLDMNNITMEKVVFPMTLGHIDLSNNPMENLDNVNMKELLVSGVHVKFREEETMKTRYKMNMDILPKTIFDQNKTSASLECRVCCERIVTGEEITTLPCMHMYHCQCIDVWASERGNCPECRHRIDDVGHLRPN